jgi:iron-sulfur cluster assembly accessory protein
MPTMSVTTKAAEKVRGFMADEENKGKALRVYVEGGGCAGFQYGLAFDDKRDTDEVIGQEGFELVIDPMSQMYLDGATIDYIEGLYGAGFKIVNPNSSGSCGCGHSFSA